MLEKRYIELGLQELILSNCRSPASKIALALALEALLPSIDGNLALEMVTSAGVGAEMGVVYPFCRHQAASVMVFAEERPPLLPMSSIEALSLAQSV